MKVGVEVATLSRPAARRPADSMQEYQRRGIGMTRRLIGEPAVFGRKGGRIWQRWGLG